LGQEVGLPIDPPKRNVNSRFALETAELVRAKEGDDAVGVFYQDVSRAFFTKHADISKREVIVPTAERFGISAREVAAAWNEHRFSPAVDIFMEEGHVAGVTGVPAMAWPHRRAIVGMMPAADLARRLQNEAHGRSLTS
jgi:predicted DsbA family dithiol-disulfide isomerase